MKLAIASAYDLPDGSRIELCTQRDGRRLWAVRNGGNCLSSAGEWECEPTPSGRDAAFLARCRLDSAEAAYAAWQRSQPSSAAAHAGQDSRDSEVPVPPLGWIPAATAEKLAGCAHDGQFAIKSASPGPGDVAIYGPNEMRTALSMERDRLCDAIKSADDVASAGDYMLDSNDCIAVIRGEWAWESEPTVSSAPPAPAAGKARP